MGVMSLAEYRSIWYDEPLELAQQHIKEAKREKTQDIVNETYDENNPAPP